MRARLLAFLRSQRLAVQASVSASGHPQAAVVGYAVTDRLEIVFDTLASSRKAQNLRLNPRVALTVGGLTQGDERTVQYEGIADEPTGAALARLTQVYYAVYPDGVSRSSEPGLTYVRVRPTWLRDSDYNVSPPELIEYRQATREDGHAMAVAHRDSIQSLGSAFYPPAAIAAWQEGISSELYAKAMDRGETFFIATRGANVLGFASDYVIDGARHGASAYVSGRVARHGIASVLFCLAEAHALMRGAASVEVEASLSGVQFYRRHGFVDEGSGECRLTTGQSIACVFMRKELNER